MPVDPQRVVLSPTCFREHMRWLSENCTLISLEDLLLTVRSEMRFRRRTVAVTFDDGYADNLHGALPILKEIHIPATVFVTSGYIGTKREFWWDDIERILLRTKCLPNRLQINVGDRVVSHHSATSGDRERLYELMLHIAKMLPPGERDTLLVALAEWAQVSRDGRQSHRALTVDELKELDSDPLITIGAHTVSHPMLSVLPVEAQEEEILGSKAALEGMLGHAVKLFSYPFGQRTDYNDTSRAICTKAGFEAAFTASKGVIRRAADVDLLALPRLCVQDMSVNQFSDYVNSWFVHY